MENIVDIAYLPQLLLEYDLKNALINDFRFEFILFQKFAHCLQGS